MIRIIINYLLNIFEDRTFGATRSSKWSSVRKEHLEKYPACAVCDKKSSLLNPIQVHHCRPFHLKPELELEPSNLISLCPDHHLFIGHLMNFRSWNENVKADADYWNREIKARP